jgi:hypothetical protein
MELLGWERKMKVDWDCVEETALFSERSGNRVRAPGKSTVEVGLTN